MRRPTLALGLPLLVLTAPSTSGESPAGHAGRAEPEAEPGTLDAGPLDAGALDAGALDAARFVENGGQWPAEVRFRVARGVLSAWVLADGFLVELRQGARGAAVEFHLEQSGCDGPRGELPRAGRESYLAGSPARWGDGVASFERVRFARAVPGVDLVLREGRGLFEYDLEVAPGVAADALCFRVEGAEGVELGQRGELRVHTGLGVLEQSPPLAWTTAADGARRPVPCRFVLLGRGRFAFAVSGRERDEPLVIDPGVEWGTYVGGYESDVVLDVAIAPGGDVVLVGTTSGPSFPVSRGTYDLTFEGASDAFVARTSPDGATLRFATFLGGAGTEIAHSVAVGPAGQVVVAGETDSADFPATGGSHDPSHNGGGDAFVAILEAGGGALLAATYLGHAGDERARGVHVDDSLRVTVCGATNSPLFPTTPGAFDTSYNGGALAGDAFVVRFEPSLGGLEYSTFLGGGGNELALGLDVEGSGAATVCGLTTSIGFPTTPGALDPTANGGGTAGDGFVSRLLPSGAGLVWSTFLGGGAADAVEDLALFPDGSVAVAGATDSDDFPTTPGAFDGTYGGGGDAFAAHIAADGAALVHATFLGEGAADRALGVAAGTGGELFVTGATHSPQFPVTPWAWDTSFASPPDGSSSDVFVARLEPDGGLGYATFVGGAQDEVGLAIALDGAGGAVVVGSTSSWTFPSYGGFDTSYDFSGVPDGFAVYLEFSRFPFEYGPVKTNSLGWEATVGAGFPTLAEGSHGIFLDLAVPNSPGWLFRGSGPAQIPFQGGFLNVAPPFVRVAPVYTDILGADTVTIPIDASMVGGTRYYQFWFADPGDAHGVGLSAGMEVTYYP